MVLPESHNVFGALGDPTRQQLIDWMVAEGSGTATEFASRLPITRQAVARHLGELERAGLAVSEKVGRESIYRPTTDTLDVAIEWLAERSSRWASTLEELARHVEDDDS